ncbi:MAG: AraC family transcriptional regulator [Daejeonella sp.]|uniref:helix-turn-helix domain-containing protein n=1 Tax=Daejeonella sp. TaxID=2805397 RepID=UPI00273410C6|nr:AraC family transcriptional regulator [Daejeonella sp.]MDP3468590.1 AraC family transcriptional regulator [Daejeonella sp.]
MELYIKNMVCNRCITAVQNVLFKLELHPIDVQMGMVRLKEDKLDEQKLLELNKHLNSLGFELLDKGKSRVIEQIKNLIIEKIFHSEFLEQKINWSGLISDKVFHEYSYLSSLFSSVEGITIEQYIIRQKIERVKELLFYDELNLGEIANKLGYSSIAHLSAQFKKVTGQTPTQFKNNRASDVQRRSIDNV